MSITEDAHDLEQLHLILEKAGAEGIRLDVLFDSLKVNVQDVEALMDFMDRLATLERNGLAHSDIIQKRDGRGITSEIRWFSGKKPKGTRALLGPGVFPFLFLFLF